MRALYIASAGDVGVRETYSKLKKLQIQDELGRLYWQPQRRHQHHRRIIQYESADVRARDEWPKISAWLKDRAEAFHATFGPLVRDLAVRREGLRAPNGKGVGRRRRGRRKWWRTNVAKATRAHRDRFLLDKLRDEGWNVAATARRLRMYRSQLYSMIAGSELLKRERKAWAEEEKKVHGQKARVRGPLGSGLSGKSSERHPGDHHR
jgi:hypothetical protein